MYSFGVIISLVYLKVSGIFLFIEVFGFQQIVEKINIYKVCFVLVQFYFLRIRFY